MNHLLNSKGKAEGFALASLSLQSTPSSGFASELEFTVGHKLGRGDSQVGSANHIPRSPTLIPAQPVYDVEGENGKPGRFTQTPWDRCVSRAMKAIVPTWASCRMMVDRAVRIFRPHAKRKCYLHIGTHKTGTTSLQMALSAHRPTLEKHGFYYPAAGILSGTFGHHALAWELSGDARCQAGSKVAASVINEIGSIRHNVILSAEDLECVAYERTSAFSDFIRSLKSCGFEVIVVVYLRNQVDYVRSLYVEMLKHGYPGPLASFLEEGLEHGVIRWNKRCAPLCYGDLLSRLRDCHDGQIIVRSYDAAKPSVVDDFCSLLNVRPEVIGMDASIRANREIPLEESFRLFCINRNGVPPHTSLAPVFEKSGFFPNDAEIGLSERWKAKIAKRFSDSDRSMLKAFGLLDLPMNIRQMDASMLLRPLSLCQIFSAEFAQAATQSRVAS